MRVFYPGFFCAPLVFFSIGSPQAKAAPFAIIHQEETKQGNIKLVQITDQLESPWGLVFLPDGDALITQKTGGIVKVSMQSGTVNQISGGPQPLVLGQGGLLDIALSPDFATDPWVYISYSEGTRKQNHTSIARARLQEDYFNDLQIIFQANTDEKSGGAHFGSRLVFDRDGYLYASIGDGFSWSKQAQNPKNHFGAIVRLNANGSIPDDNPFADGVSGAPEVWSFGHRNPQGLALHPKTGALWQSEHGPKGGDEINIISKGGNYGWPKATHGRGYSGRVISEFSSLPGMIDPVLHWTPSIAPSGLTFYRGEKFPRWQGDLFSGALAAKHLRRVKLNGTIVTEQEELLNELGQRIRHVVLGPDQLLYILTDSGLLLRIEPDE